jgi:hypothetical protein
MKQARPFILGAAVLLGGCLTPSRVATRPGFDFSTIRTITVVDQSRDETRSVTDEIARQLIRRGYSVKVADARRQAQASDARLEVHVTQLTPDKKYLMQVDPGNDGRTRDVFILNQGMEISGRSVYPSMGGTPIEGTQVVVSNATVSLSARLLGPETDEILWSAATSYEGLDLDTAVEGSVASLLKKFPAR